MARIHRTQTGQICTLVIDNPSKRNAFSGDMAAKLEVFLGEADRDPSVRCIIITGEGDTAFSSGHDLGEMIDHLEHAFGKDVNAGFMRPLSVRKPVIAAVNGFAYAAGFILAMSCDIRVASENARFSTPGAKVGLLPIGGQLSRLFHLLPHGKVLQLLYTGAPMPAAEAHMLGFVSALTPAGKVLEAANEMAAQICANSPAVVREIKRGVEHAVRRGVGPGEDFEWATAEALLTSPDMLEGIRAFLEKRPPRFQDPTE